MGVVQKAGMRAEEFLAWEERQELRWEFDGVAPRAMTGGTAEHDTVQGNLFTSLGAKLRGTACRLRGPGLKVATGEGRYRYPDAFVRCGPLALGQSIVHDPVVVFEITSRSTARIDWSEKLIEYRSIASVKRYVLIEQDQALVTVITRREELWSIDVLQAGEVLAMPEIGAELAVDELYVDVEFPAKPDDAVNLVVTE